MTNNWSQHLNMTFHSKLLSPISKGRQTSSWLDRKSMVKQKAKLLLLSKRKSHLSLYDNNGNIIKSLIPLWEKSRNKTNTFCKKHLWYCKKRSWQERGILHWSNFFSCKRLLWYKNHKLQKSNSARDTSGIASLSTE